MTSFSARVISCYLRSEDYRPHNSLEKNRQFGPSQKKKEQLVRQDCYIVVIGRRICLYTDNNLWYDSFVKVYPFNPKKRFEI